MIDTVIVTETTDILEFVIRLRPSYSNILPNSKPCLNYNSLWGGGGSAFVSKVDDKSRLKKAHVSVSFKLYSEYQNVKFLWRCLTPLQFWRTFQELNLQVLSQFAWCIAWPWPGGALPLLTGGPAGKPGLRLVHGPLGDEGGGINQLWRYPAVQSIY